MPNRHLRAALQMSDATHVAADDASGLNAVQMTQLAVAQGMCHIRMKQRMRAR